MQASINHDFHFIFSPTVELERLVEMKKAKEYSIEAKSGGKENIEESEVQNDPEEHSPLSPVLPSVSSVPSPMSPVSSPVSPVSSPGDQAQATLPSPPPPKQGGYLYYTII